jgi:hypothetical protein
MSGQAGLKAGLIGAGVMVVLVLLNLIPSLIPAVGVLGCACCGVELLAYAGAGALAGVFLSPPRTTGAGAGAGAIAGVLSGVGAGIMTIITAAGRMAFAGGQMVSAIDPAQARQLIDAGIDPQMLTIFAGWGGVFLGGGLCCLGWIAIGAGLGALGGLIFAAAKKD